MMKFQELKEKNEKELERQFSENREKLRELRFQRESGQLKNVRAIRKIKKENARILTILNQRRRQIKDASSS